MGLNQLLEKRVSSRLNTQYLFLPSITARQACEYMAERLSLPPTFVRECDDGNSHQYRKKFNSLIVKSFGKNPADSSSSKEGGLSSNSNKSVDDYDTADEDDGDVLDAQGRTCSLFHDIDLAVDNGATLK